MRVLYVEDNPANVFLVQRVARMGNHEVTSYIDGGQALKKFDELKPDLVLMDIQLAGETSGLEVVRQLRARGVKIPIIAVTAYAMVGDKERCMEAGCDDYLAKPLPVAHLVDIFEKYSNALEARVKADTVASASQLKAQAQQTAPDNTKADTVASISQLKAQSEQPALDQAQDIAPTSAAQSDSPQEEKSAAAEVSSVAETKSEESSSADEVVPTSTQAESDMPESLSESSENA